MKTLKFHLVIIVILIVNFQNLNAQDGTRIQPDKACINCDTPTANAVLEVRSTTTGILIPRMTTTERDAISPLTQGLLVYDMTTSSFWYYKNGVDGWMELDNDKTNEIQTLSKSGDGSMLFLSNGGGSVPDEVDDADNNPSNEIQNLSSVLAQDNDANASKIENLAEPTLAQDAATKNYVDVLEAADLDKNPTNEIQNLKNLKLTTLGLKPTATLKG